MCNKVYMDLVLHETIKLTKNLQATFVFKSVGGYTQNCKLKCDKYISKNTNISRCLIQSHQIFEYEKLTQGLKKCDLLSSPYSRH